MALKARIYVHTLHGIPQIGAASVVLTRKIGPEEIGILREVRDLTEPKFEQFARRFDRGDECYISSIEGKVVHFSWVRLDGSMYVSAAKRERKFSAGTECWIYDCRTNELARGKGIYPLTLSRILMEKKNAGFKRVFIDVDAENIASVKGIEKVGFEVHEKLTTIHIIRNIYIRL